jgi:DNA mismatch repair protein MutL
VVYAAVRAALGSAGTIAEGAARQARINRGVSYDETSGKSTNASFFSDSPDRVKVDSEASKKLHENLMEARDAFYGTGHGVEKPISDTELPDDKTSESYDIGILDKGRFSGILFNTFIMLELDGEEILLIDQHAAHERITYEGLLERFRNNDTASQGLPSPTIVGLSQAEAASAEENRELLEKLGFEFDFIGPKDAAVRAIPAEITEKDTVDVFRGALDAIMTNANTEHMLRAKETIYTMACKSSVKANTLLNEIEVQVLLKRLKTLENPYTCPHGRPVIVRLTRRELEKLFKRIV